MSAIFISHSHSNNDLAIILRDWLISNGWGPSQIFLDLDELSTGDRWRIRLNAIGHNCVAVIVCLSDAWIASPECVREFTHAESKGKPIFPIRIEEISVKIPSFITDLQITDVSNSETTSAGYQELKLALHRARIAPEYFPWPPPDEPERLPYRGLQALTEKDAAVFFGRDAHIASGLDKLRQIRDGSAPRVLTITAASGAGKSSFLKAGLLARLKRDTEAFLVLPTIRPGTDALNGEEGLIQALSLQDQTTSDEQICSQLDELQANAVRRIQPPMSDLEQNRPVQPPTIVLPIDQAEEIFAANNVTGKAALDLIVCCLKRKLDFAIVVTIRSDSLGALQADNRIAEHLELFNLSAIPPSLFKEIIEGPGAIADPPIEFEPALIERLIKDLNDKDALPLLAFTLERLLIDYGDDHLLELSEYTQGLGGVSGAINAAVEAAFEKAAQDPELPNLREELEALARKTFIPRLVQLEHADSSPLRRVADLATVAEDYRRLIQHFVDERLLVSYEHENERIVEVSHEAVLRHWQGLAEWVRDERFLLERLTQIERASQEYSRRATDKIPATDLLVHRGERLVKAEQLMGRADMQEQLGAEGVDYLGACRNYEVRVTLEVNKRESRLRDFRRLARVATTAVSVATVIGAYYVGKGQRKMDVSQSLSLARLANVAYKNGDFLSSLRLSILASRETAIVSPEPEALASLASASQALRQQAAFQHKGSIYGAVFSADESRIMSWSADSTVRLWDRSSGKQIGPELQHDGEVIGAVFSADESRIMSWSADSTARLWESSSGKQIGPELQHDDEVIGAVFSNDENQVLSWSADSTARLWDRSSGKQIGPELQHDGQVMGAVFSDDENRVLSWSLDGTARQWDSTDNKQIGPALQHENKVFTDFPSREKRRSPYPSPVWGAVFSTDESRILSWSYDDTARLWNTYTGTQIGPTLQHSLSVRGAVFSKDESRILSWSNDRTARIWNAATGTQIGSSLRHNASLGGAVFSTDESHILSWSEDGTARLWDSDSGKQIGPTLQHGDEVYGAVFSADESRILSWSSDGTVRLWNSATGVQVGPALQHDKSVLGAKLSADERRILSWSSDGTARLWDSSISKQIWPSLKHDRAVFGAIFSGDETRILSWSDDGTARLWNNATGQQIGPKLQHDAHVLGAVFTDDESYILSWSADSTARLWDTATGAQIGSALLHGRWVNGAVFSADAKRILSWSMDGTVRLWNSATGQQIGPKLQHDDAVMGAVFSVNENHILSWSEDNTARLWDSTTGTQIGLALLHKDRVYGAVFSADEKRILSWSGDGTARLWDSATGAQIGPALQHNEEDRENEVIGAVFSTDERRILSWGDGGTARLWDSDSGKQIGPALQHDDEVLGAVFSADESRILSWSSDGTVRLWNSTTGVQIGPGLQHDGSVLGAKLSADESRILSWSSDGTAWLWDSATGVQIGPALQHDERVLGALFSTDERHILSWSTDKTARQWNVEWAMRPTTDDSYIADICATKLLGNVIEVDSIKRSPRHLDAGDIEIAPILRGREGEDVCDWSPPWYQKFLLPIFDFIYD